MTTQFKILVGILFTLATLAALIILGVNEENRMTQTQAVFLGRNIERGAEYFAAYCWTCHGERGEGIPGKGPPLNRKDLLDTKNNPYLRAIRFLGTLDDFLHDTIAAGRPQPSAFYAGEHFGQSMPTWSQDYGGPLRPDQVDSLVAYIENWAPGQFPPLIALATPTAGPSPTAAPTPAGGVKPPFPLPPSQEVIAAGKAIYEQKDKCILCHGEKGDGKGIAAAGLNPPPRDFTNCDAMKQFAMGTHYAAVVNGKPGTGMPAWKDKLSDEQIWEVVMYERSFCGLFTP